MFHVHYMDKVKEHSQFYLVSAFFRNNIYGPQRDAKLHESDWLPVVDLPFAPHEGALSAVQHRPAQHLSPSYRSYSSPWAPEQSILTVISGTKIDNDTVPASSPPPTAPPLPPHSSPWWHRRPRRTRPPTKWVTVDYGRWWLSIEQEKIKEFSKVIVRYCRDGIISITCFMALVPGCNTGMSSDDVYDTSSSSIWNTVG